MSSIIQFWEPQADDPNHHDSHEEPQEPQENKGHSPSIGRFLIIIFHLTPSIIHFWKPHSLQSHKLNPLTLSKQSHGNSICISNLQCKNISAAKTTSIHNANSQIP